MIQEQETPKRTIVKSPLKSLRIKGSISQGREEANND